MRVFLGLTEIAGYYRGLHRGLREIGVESVYACAGHQFGYDGGAGEQVAWPVRWFRRMSLRRLAAAKRGRLTRALWKVGERASRVPLLVWALCRCDVFVFGFGSCFFSPRELWLFRLLGRRTIHVFHGSDNRPHWMDGAQMKAERMTDPAAVLRESRRQRRHLRVLEKYSSCLVSHPTTAQYFERPYVNWLRATGLPFGGEATEPVAEERGDRPVRILHSPSDPAAKGTEFIRGMVRRLEEKGCRIDYREVTGRPNAEVLAELRACDFVIDQVWADTPMAGFATEAAHCGKPALVGGYAQEICGRMDWPCALYCRPEEMESLAERLVRDAEFRRECGRRAQEFVQTEWSRRTIAENWKRILADDIPAEWMVQPEEVNYLEGAGLPAERLRESIRCFVQHGGPDALGMGHRPDLQAALLARAEGKA